MNGTGHGNGTETDAHVAIVGNPGRNNRCCQFLCREDEHDTLHSFRYQQDRLIFFTISLTVRLNEGEPAVMSLIALPYRAFFIGMGHFDKLEMF